VRYRVSDDVIDRDIGDELLVHRFDTDEVFVLNSAARLVFLAVKEVGTHEEILERIVTEVFGDTAALHEAVGRAIDEMVRQGVIVRDETPAG
jgi:hypothetical protein